jgi:hypothetical protein
MHPIFVKEVSVEHFTRELAGPPSPYPGPDHPDIDLGIGPKRTNIPGLLIPTKYECLVEIAHRRGAYYLDMFV